MTPLDADHLFGYVCFTNYVQTASYSNYLYLRFPINQKSGKQVVASDTQSEKFESNSDRLKRWRPQVWIYQLNARTISLSYGNKFRKYAIHS